ncbi:DinB family protein [Mucilaginibacter sp. RB4R14]|uniref:DinB family protein n=1 Tax=Mucilaginibacter aurantiaciroseus TaxID=2949308 RepID=UPI002091B787|nr:DinB family protein [Mucilaginibacter aurantiaciroseus]MCO5935144.1 DinB family protein [Mucilaginibacter aurantiaciroseus]
MMFTFTAMKSHFIFLLKYDHFANQKIAELIVQTAATGKPVELMAHLLTAQQTWLNRLNKTTAPPANLWPNWSADTLTTINNDNHQQLVACVEAIPEQDFENVIGYTNSVGYCENTITDILTHLINHGTHHRAQMGTLLKLDGATLPMLDYVLYIRNLNQNV